MVWGELEEKKIVSGDNRVENVLDKPKFNFYFSGVFLLVLTKFSFWYKDWETGYNSMKFLDFPDIS